MTSQTRARYSVGRLELVRCILPWNGRIAYRNRLNKFLSRSSCGRCAFRNTGVSRRTHGMLLPTVATICKSSQQREPDSANHQASTSAYVDRFGRRGVKLQSVWRHDRRNPRGAGLILILFIPWVHGHG